MRLVNSIQMQEMDQNTIEVIGVPGIVLMENAARSWVEAAKPYISTDSDIFVLCGSGNNGGDGYAIARNLISSGYSCRTVEVKPPKSSDCQLNAKVWSSYGESISWENFLETKDQIKNDDTLIDAVLGTGIESKLRGDLVEKLSVINAIDAFKMSVDIPSGISASTGDLLGVGIKNDITITFQKEKIGHHLYPGKTYSGKTICQPITIKNYYRSDAREYSLITKKMVKNLIPLRNPEAYKNKFGHLVTWCGSAGTLGASFLASFGAMKVGTGLTTAALPKGLTHTFLSKAPELMSCEQEEISLEFLKQFNAITIGCGLGRNQELWNKIVSIVQELNIPIVFDADAFYGIDKWDSLELKKMVLTPHPGEFANLTKQAKPSTNKERIEQGIRYVEEFKTTLVLKGAPTIIFSETGAVFINSTGNSGMATAGSGDVLAGIIGGFLAQGLPPLHASLVGVWLHGKSGDIYSETHNEESLTASSLLDNLDKAFTVLKS